MHRAGNTDVAVPLSRLTEIVETSKREAAEIGLKATVKGHVGDSNFHENIYYDATNPADVAKAEKLVKSMVRRAVEMDGSCTGEHGVGFGKKGGLMQEVGEDTIALMVGSLSSTRSQGYLLTDDQKLIKSTLDPHWIMYVLTSHDT